MSFNLILPELYGYLQSLGGQDYKGWIIATFTVMAAVSRPFSGKMADTVGRVPTMIVGSIVSGVSAILYIFIEEAAQVLTYFSPVFLFLVLRFFHGMSTGFKPTGTASYLDDIVPPTRKGEAMGWLGFAGSVGMALGPVIGNYLQINHGYNAMFAGSSVLAFLSLVVILGLKETLPQKHRNKINHKILKVNKQDLYEPLVAPPALTFLLYAFSFGAVYTLIPDKTDYLGIPEYRGYFFLIYVGFTTFTRIIAGKLSDMIGRVPIIVFGLIVIIVAMVVLAYAETVNLLFIGGAIFGIAHGITGPTLFAWTSDLSSVNNRGRAFSTMYIGMEVGIGGGALLSFQIYNNQPENMFYAFITMAWLSFLALVYLFIRWQNQKRLNNG